MELRDYLRRIGVDGPVGVDLGGLRRLHRAHLLAIPYENLDIHLGRPLSLDLAATFRKLVIERRGGWCYEMNGLFAWALRELGFPVTLLSATVGRATKGDGVEGNHLALLVMLDRPYLADVGFGDGFLEPLPLEPGSYRQGFLDFRLEMLGDRWMLTSHPFGGAPGFDFTTESRELDSFAERCHELQTSPDSGFVRRIVVERFQSDGGIRMLRGAVLRSVREGGVEEEEITSAARYQDVLRREFDLDVPAAEGLWPRIWEEHQSYKAAAAPKRRRTVFDFHCDSLQRAVCRGTDLGVATDGQADLPAWEAGGVYAQVFAVWIDTIYAPYHAARRALQQIDAFHELLARHPEQVELATTGADIRRIRDAGRLAALLSIEGGVAIQNDLALLRIYERLGATSLTLTHTTTIDWVDSSTDVERWGGLTEFGREVIAELNRIRMIVDVSHVSDRTIEQVVGLSTRPVIASHSSARALCDHPRNIPDHLARAVADTGGVVGVNFYAEFLDQGYRDEMATRHGAIIETLNRPSAFPPGDLDRLAEERRVGFFRDMPPRPPFDRILEHIDHLVSTVGIDHVGIGADLDSSDIPVPLGFDSVRDYPKVIDGLSRRGYSDDRIEKIMGGNFLRVLTEVRGS